jgi:predicted 2-oxoglutarate/Fe(II)-dependent dioxygenase YbiX
MNRVPVNVTSSDWAVHRPAGELCAVSRVNSTTLHTDETVPRRCRMAFFRYTDFSSISNNVCGVKGFFERRTA